MSRNLKENWHIMFYTVRNIDDKMERDTTPITCSAPERITGTIGNGTISVTLLPNVKTEGFTASFSTDIIKQTSTWTLTNTHDKTTVFTQAGVTPTAGTTWILTMENNVQVTITQGTTSFVTASDGFKFSTFNTLAPKGKEYEIGFGPIDVLDVP